MRDAPSTIMQHSGWRSFLKSPILSYVAPFGLFMLMGVWEQPESGFYPALYSVKIAIVAAACWLFRKRYPPPAWHGVGLGCVVGLVGAVVWIGLARLNLEASLSASLPAWLYSGQRSGFNPFQEIASTAGQWAFVATRLAGLVIVVPVMEEVFWRGFLLRYLVSEDFENVPVGRYTPFSLAGVTILFTLVHPELLAAAVWGAAVTVLLYRTKNLSACIAAHAVTNLLLGGYILAEGNSWHLW